VPWDQALNLVLQSRNLDKRLVGNVLYVAPANEIAAQEQQALDASRQAQALAPLQTEYIQVNYADAANILLLLTGSPTGSAATPAPAPDPAAPAAAGVPAESGATGVLSSRGTATVDARTNIIIIRDVAEKLDEVRELLSKLDVPVRQVLIEARIVNVSTDFGRDLGIRWGGAGRTDSSDGFRYGGSQGATLEQQNNRVAEASAIQEALAAGEAARVQALQDGTDPSLIGSIVAQAIAAVPIPIGTTSFPDALAVDLGVQDESASSFSVGFTSNSGLIELELSALESSGNGEVIARPKVTTQDKVTATIQSGVRIPYQAQAGGTAGGSTTEFVDAVLSLEVTPQITPDGRIIMQLDIHQDSVAAGTGTVPAINTNSINTSVLVENGDTIVLGGVFREETTTTETKTPLLGDVPYLGRLFKRTNNENRRTELLIFITPRIIAEINTR
jgi:type IV pilus assembly protein PilQ